VIGQKGMAKTMREDGLELARKQVAIFYADVEGYTRLTELDEVETHRTVVSYLRAITDKITSHRGRVDHYAGDAVLADFDTAARAIECAAEIQRDLAERRRDIPVARQVRFRIGINFESVIVDNGAVHGGGVNIAARIEELSDSGGICISGAAYDAAGNALPFECEFLGERILKNLQEPIRLYRVLFDEASRQVAEQRTKAEEYSRPVIVVLPLGNLSGKADDEYLCDGLTQDITTDLSKFHDLLVIPSTGAFEYKDKPLDLQSLHRELGARYLLSGSVLRSDETIRVNASLIETKTGVQVWSQRFDRDFSDLLATQDELVREVVSSISAEVATKESSHAIRRDPNSASAYDAFLRGHYHWWQLVNVQESKDKWLECQKWFQRATELDPEYSRPWAWLAYATVDGYHRGWCEKASLEKAEAMAKKSVRLGAKDYDAHWALAFYYRYVRKFEQSIIEYSEACALNPNEPDLIIEMAETLAYMGRYKEAIAQLEKSMSLNPLCADFCRSTLAWSLYITRRYGDSLLQLSHISNPTKDDMLVTAASHARNAESYAQSGQSVIAREEARLASSSIRDLLRMKPDCSIALEREAEIFQHEEDEKFWLDGLRLAGLPER